MADERDRPQPGAVPQFVSPQQVTAPLPLHPVTPWGYMPPPPPDPKAESHGGIKLAIQIIMAALGLGGVIFTAGAAREKLNSIEANQKSSDGLRAEHKRQQDERDREIAGAIDRIRQDVRDLTNAVEVKQARWQRHVRRREADLDSRP